MDFLQDKNTLWALALGLGIVLWRLVVTPQSQPIRPYAAMVAGLGCFGLAYAPIGAQWAGYEPLRWSAMGSGLFAGAMAALFSEDGEPAYAFAAAAMASGWLLAPTLISTPSNLLTCGFASAIGLVLGAILSGRLHLSGSAALLTVGISALQTLGLAQLAGVHTQPGLLTLLVLAFTAVVILASQRGANKVPKGLMVGLHAVLVGSLLFVIGSRNFQLSEAGLAGLVGAAIAALLVWAIPEEGEAPVVVSGFAAILMIALGTAAFAEARGMGMIFAALGACSVAIVSGHKRAFLLCTPLLVLALYRGFGVAFPDAARALDIGQHYGLIGLMVGLLAALALQDLWEQSHHGAKGLGLFAGVLACAFSPVLIGAKGAVGLLVGLGFAGVLSLLAQRKQAPTAIATLLMGSLISAYPMVREQMDLTRAERLPLLLGVGAAILVCSVAATLLVRPTLGIPQESA